MTPSPTPTETATPDYYVYLTTPAGEGARIDRSFNMADYVIILLLIGIVASKWAFRFWDRMNVNE